MTPEAPLLGPLEAVFTFDVDGLLVHDAEMGRKLEMDVAGHRVELHLPASATTGLPIALHPEERAVVGRHSDGADVRHVISLLQVSVFTGRSLGDEGAGNAEQTLIDYALPFAERAARQLVDWARMHDGQPWLPPRHAPLRQRSAARLRSADGTISRGYGRELSVLVLFPPDQLPSGAVSMALHSVDDPVADLMAEAKWAVWPAHPADTKRAVLLATTALEVGVPQALLRQAEGSTAELLNAVLRRYDEIPVSVNLLLNEIAEAVLGESLQKHDGALNKRVKALVRQRNEVAHRGATPYVSDAQSGVAAAADALTWVARSPPRSA